VYDFSAATTILVGCQETLSVVHSLLALVEERWKSKDVSEAVRLVGIACDLLRPPFLGIEKKPPEVRERPPRVKKTKRKK